MKPLRCPGEWHELRYVSDTIAVCIGGHESVVWEVAGDRVRLEPNRVARRLADELLAVADTVVVPDSPTVAPTIVVDEPTPELASEPEPPAEVAPVVDDGPPPWASVSLQKVLINGRAYAELVRLHRAGNRPVRTTFQWSDVREAFLRWQAMHGLKSKDVAQMAGVGRGVMTEMTTGPRPGRQPVPPALRRFLVECVFEPEWLG